MASEAVESVPVASAAAAGTQAQVGTVRPNCSLTLRCLQNSLCALRVATRNDTVSNVCLLVNNV